MGVGRDKFSAGLKELGFIVEGKDDLWVIIRQYKIEEGTFSDISIDLAFEVRSDFPLTAPHGPHVKPRLFPLNPNSKNHKERMHKSSLGDDWGLLSRPFPNWENTNRSVKEYMRYAKHLLETL